MRNIIVSIAILLSISVQAQKFDGLAQTPPMGWNSWNTFRTDINEQLVKDIADKIVELGLKKAGYEYIVLDDGWMAKERDANGNLVADPKKFPSGMKALADYIHSKGLKFGLYNCAGAKTCAGYPGSRGHEFQDARLYASGDVDYLKYDWCNTDKINADQLFSVSVNGEIISHGNGQKILDIYGELLVILLIVGTAKLVTAHGVHLGFGRLSICEKISEK